MMYLVAYIGIYDDNEGDHSFWLFDNEKDARKKFLQEVKSARKYYEKELGVEPTYYDDFVDEGQFSLVTDSDKVDIHWQQIECDGKLWQCAY